MLTILTAAVLLAAAPIQVPPGWGIVGDQERKYFVEDPGNVVRRELVDSRNVGSATDRRNEQESEKREFLKPEVSEVPRTESAIVNPADRRLEGRLLKTYEVKRIDKVRYVTTKTPYVDYKVVDYEKRVRTQFLNTYAVVTQYTWTDPFTGETVTFKTRVVEPPTREESAGDWEPAQDKKAVGNGKISKTVRVVDHSSTQDRLLATVTAPASIDEETLSARSRELVVSAGERGRGSQGGANATAGRSFSLSGSARTQAAGGLRLASLGDLFAFAARGANFADDAGRLAWRLGVAGDLLVFTPIDSAGAAHAERALRVDKSLRPAAGPGGAVVQIATFEVGSGASAVLTGTFRNPYLGGNPSRYLASR